MRVTTLPDSAVQATWRALAVAQKLESRGVLVLSIQADGGRGPQIIAVHCDALEAAYPDARDLPTIHVADRPVRIKEAIDSGVSITWGFD